MMQERQMSPIIAVILKREKVEATAGTLWFYKTALGMLTAVSVRYRATNPLSVINGTFCD